MTEPNTDRKRGANDIVNYHDPLNCTDLKWIEEEKTTDDDIKDITRTYYSKIELTYSDGKIIRFHERTDKKQNHGSYGLVVHYESKNFPVTLHFSIKYTGDHKEFAMVSKINRMREGEPCGQIKIKSIDLPHYPTRDRSLYLFLSKTYEGSLDDFTDEDRRLDKKKIPDIILQVRDQLICLRKKYSMCYMDIKPGNILYLYPGGNGDQKNIEVALGDLGSDGISTYSCVSSENNTTYRNGSCRGTELLSDCQKYTLSLTYLFLRDGYKNWIGITMSPGRNTVRRIQDALRSDLISGGKTMYEIIWEPGAEVTGQRPDPRKIMDSFKILEIYRKLMDAMFVSEILALDTVRRQKHINSGEREAAKREIGEADRIERHKKIYSDEGIDESVFESDFDEYIRADASFKAVIEHINAEFNMRLKKEQNEREEKFPADMFYCDPLNCTDLKWIEKKEATNDEIKDITGIYYSKIELTYSDDKIIQFQERTDKKQNHGSYGLVVHYESMNIRGVIRFSIRYSNDHNEHATVSKINRRKGSRQCGQLKIKNISWSRHPTTDRPLFLFLSKTYDGNLEDLMGEGKRLDKKKIQNIIVQIKDQLICLKKKYNMCYMNIRPGNILYLYPDRNDDQENIEVVLGDLGSDGITSFRCVSSRDNTAYREGKCKDDELLSDCQKYTLSLTYLFLRDGYEDWLRIATYPNADRNTVRNIQNELRLDMIPGDKTMYEIIWEPEAEVNLKMIEILRKLGDAVVAAEVLALETVHRRKYADSGEREAAKKEIRAANQRKRWDKIFSEEGIDESVFESEMEEYKSADAGFKVVIEDIYDDFNARIETARNNFRIL